MKKEFLIAKKTTGQLNALVKNIGGIDVMDRINKGAKFLLIFDNNCDLDSIELQIFWKKFYRKYFGIDVDTSIISNIKYRWVVFIPKDLTVKDVWNVLPFHKHLFLADSVNSIGLKNKRETKKDYIFSVRNNIEASDELRFNSIDDLIDHESMTLLERLILELSHFEKTGNHLDIKSNTLCLGSVGSNGYFPCLTWGKHLKRLDIWWVDVLDLDNKTRSREVFLN